MKRLLIISPYFPPSNAADMQRVRMSLPYFKQFGWDAEVVCVDEIYSDVMKDDLLRASLPKGQIIHKIKAFTRQWTSKLGFGSLGFRSFWFYRKKVNSLLRAKKYDLIYFSTTQFPVCVLGAYWKRKFGIPYVIDMQDPWYSDYYKDKPKSQRPPKYLLIYSLHKKLEAIAMKKVDGLISVSANYLEILESRYLNLVKIPGAVITFGAFEPDLKIAANNRNKFDNFLQPGFTNIVYIGRGGLDMYKAIAPVFEALQKGLKSQPALFGRLKFYFIGTSYAPEGEGTPTILPLAIHYGVEGAITEITDRIGYYHTLLTLQQADILFIPGSDDPKYTASKIYPYLLTQKPLLAVFNENSNAVVALSDCVEDATVLTFNNEPTGLADALYPILTGWAEGVFKPVKLLKNFQNYSAENLTGKQTELFEQTINYFATKNTNT